MFVIRELRIEEINDFLVADPNVCYLGLTDNELYILYMNKSYMPLSSSEFAGVFDGEELIMLVRSEPFTRDTISLHLFLATKYHHTGKLREIQAFLKDYYRTQTEYKKIVVMSPETCVHVHKVVEAFGFSLEGRLTKCITWRNELVDLLLYGWIIERN